MGVATSLSRWKSWLWPVLRRSRGWVPSSLLSAAKVADSGVDWVLRVPSNEQGRDFAVGDIHGCFAQLQRVLDEIGFDPEVDRLFSVGDLVDRGPESDQVLAWLDKPWFFAVCGNHDYMAWRTAEGNPFELLDHRKHGGEWMDTLTPSKRAHIGRRLQALPLAMEVGTSKGRVGLVHAGCPGNDWEAMYRLDVTQLANLKSEAGQCLWSTQRAMTSDSTRVRNIRAVVHGHTTVGRHLVLGNVHFIDTGGWRRQGYFTLLELETLMPAARVASRVN